MEINFDVFGHLKPYELLEMEWADFETTFVLAFEESQTRAKLFQTFQAYLRDLKELIGSHFYVWVGGSFVTTKMNPQDIDMVTFIPETLFSHFEAALFPFSKHGVKEPYGNDLDAYLVVLYPMESNKYVFTDSDAKYWLNQFGHSRPNRRGKQQPKGFVQLSFTIQP